MNKEYWQWKNTIIDFNAISDEKIDYNNFITKKDYVFRYLGIPDNEMHEWYSGGFSSEYNEALRYAKQLGLVEDVIDYEDKIYNLEQRVKKQKEVIDKINKYLNECDVFKVFSFPLMKKWEEEQVKASIDYEFKTSLIKDLKDILKEVSE